MNNKIDNVELRNTLFYNKYKYRARFYMDNAIRANYCTTLDIYLKTRIGDDNIQQIKSYIDWKNINVRIKKQAIIRVEGRFVSAFSNDLFLLNTLENVVSDGISYTLADASAPTGVKYFITQPRYDYRVYLKARYVNSEIKEDILSLINRYQNTNTIISPSPSLALWADPSKDLTSSFSWYYPRSGRYSTHIPYGSHFNYNDPNVYLIISLQLGNYIQSKYKLEKRP